MFHPRLSIAILLMFSLLLALGLAACGEAATPVPPTAAHHGSPLPRRRSTSHHSGATHGNPNSHARRAYRSYDVRKTTPLMEYAAMMAGGPGAIYVGDINQLVGPAPMTLSQASRTPTWATPPATYRLSALEDHLWLYESDYYQSLIEKANLTNPTELTSSGEEASRYSTPASTAPCCPARLSSSTGLPTWKPAPTAS